LSDISSLSSNFSIKSSRSNTDINQSHTTTSSPSSDYESFGLNRSNHTRSRNSLSSSSYKSKKHKTSSPSNLKKPLSIDDLSSHGLDVINSKPFSSSSSSLTTSIEEQVKSSSSTPCKLVSSSLTSISEKNQISFQPSKRTIPPPSHARPRPRALNKTLSCDTTSITTWANFDSHFSSKTESSDASKINKEPINLETADDEIFDRVDPFSDFSVSEDPFSNPTDDLANYLPLDHVTPETSLKPPPVPPRPINLFLSNPKPSVRLNLLRVSDDESSCQGPSRSVSPPLDEPPSLPDDFENLFESQQEFSENLPTIPKRCQVCDSKIEA